MPAEETPSLSRILSKYQHKLLDDWIAEQLAAPTLRPDLISEDELRAESGEFLEELRKAVERGIPEEIFVPPLEDLRYKLEEITNRRVERGFTPSEIATFVFSIKQPLFRHLVEESGSSEQTIDLLWKTSVLLDKLGLFAVDSYQKARESIIRRQREELLELSTPVVELWEGVLAVPLIGTLDSARTQVVMESLLQRLVDTESSIAIIDITGVPTVDTSVAKHLIKTVTAARLMGAECMISGISPAIAQTMVHLGVELEEIPTRANLSDALSLAFKKIGVRMVREE